MFHIFSYNVKCVREEVLKQCIFHTSGFYLVTHEGHQKFGLSLLATVCMLCMWVCWKRKEKSDVLLQQKRSKVSYEHSEQEELWMQKNLTELYSEWEKKTTKKEPNK